MDNRFIYFEVTDSTNNELRRRLQDGNRPEEFTVISAGAQTGGRGRSGHEWTSPPGVSISTSMVCYPGMSETTGFSSDDGVGIADLPEVSGGTGLPEELTPGLTILAAVAVERMVEELFSLPVQIKWPNDILLDRRKICGILTERIGDAVIVGIGVNVRRGSYPPALSDRATSIEEELLVKQSEPITIPGQITMIENIWKHFRSLYAQFLRELSLSFLLREYNDRLLNKNTIVRVMDPKGQFEAEAFGMDERGRLVVLLPDTREKIRVDSGEVQIRGIDGYV